jgi:hypothetical protein
MLQCNHQEKSLYPTLIVRTLHLTHQQIIPKEALRQKVCYLPQSNVDATDNYKPNRKQRPMFRLQRTVLQLLTNRSNLRRQKHLQSQRPRQKIKMFRQLIPRSHQRIQMPTQRKSQKLLQHQRRLPQLKLPLKNLPPPSQM